MAQSKEALGRSNAAELHCYAVGVQHRQQAWHFAWIWKVNADPTARSETRNQKCVADVKRLIPQYLTRSMKKEFQEHFGRLFVDTGASIRYLTKHVLHDASASLSKNEAAVDERFALALCAEDPDITWDVRRIASVKHNIGTTIFDPFWWSMAVEFTTAMELSVHDRRHRTVLYTPIAPSTPCLIRSCEKRLEQTIGRCMGLDERRYSSPAALLLAHVQGGGPKIFGLGVT